MSFNQLQGYRDLLVNSVDDLVDDLFVVEQIHTLGVADQASLVRSKIQSWLLQRLNDLTVDSGSE